MFGFEIEMNYSDQALALIATALFGTGVFVESFEADPRVRDAAELGISFILIGAFLFVLINVFGDIP